MILRGLKATLLTGALLLAAPSLAGAGVYSDDLGKCLVASTDVKDKTNLVRWIFAVASLHPEVKSISALTEAQRQELDKSAGALFQRLLTKDCRKQFRDATKYEGEQAIEQGFSILGSVAMRELMSDPAVTAGFGALDKHLSKEALEEAVRAEEP